MVMSSSLEEAVARETPTVAGELDFCFEDCCRDRVGRPRSGNIERSEL